MGAHVRRWVEMNEAYEATDTWGNDLVVTVYQGEVMVELMSACETQDDEPEYMAQRITHAQARAMCYAIMERIGHSTESV